MPQNPEVKVKFTADGIEGVRRGLKLVRDDAGPTGQQWGNASRQIAFGLENIARQGKVTGESLKQIISQGSNMAFAFGPQGAIVAGIVTVGVAIYEHITGKMKEAREEIRSFNEDIANLLRTNNLTGAGDLAQRMYSGDRFASPGKDESAADFQARQLGQLGLQGLIASKRADRDAALARYKVVVPLTDKTQQQWDEMKNLGKTIEGLNGELDVLTPLLEKYTDQATKAKEALDKLSAAEGKRVSVGAKLAQEQFNKEYAALTAPGGKDIRVTELGLPGFTMGAKFGKPQDYDFARSLRKVPNLLETDAGKGMIDQAKQIGNAFADTLADSIASGMQRAFAKGAGLSDVFGAIAQSALSGLGSISVQIGKAALAQMAFIKTIAEAIASWNPALGIAAAIGLIAFGSALQGAGGRIGGAGGGYGGGGGYGSSGGYGSQVIDRGIIDPTRGAANLTAKAPVNNYFNVIGERDPVAIRSLQRMLANGKERGEL